MNECFKAALIAALQQNATGNGEYLSRLASGYRPDATAWAVLALRVSGVSTLILQPALTRLAAAQKSDGRVCVSSEHPEAFWPTALAILAWNATPEFRPALSRAAQFLLKTAGSHFPKEKDAPFAHDPSIRGWPWIDGTHSWVIPSALAVIALKAAGYSEHERVLEATRLLLDRQLRHGGWNYGNTRVYGQELTPLVESTGVALTALAGSISRPEIDPSLGYLKKWVGQTRTPLSLSWGLLALASWGAEPSEGESWLEACWRQRERYGGYDTVTISLMLLALVKETPMPGKISGVGKKT